MKIKDLEILLGKTRQEVEDMLKNKDVIELNLKETRQREAKDIGEIEVIR